MSPNMKFTEYIQKQVDEFMKAGDGYEALSDTSKSCVDYAVQRFVDEYAKQQAIEFDKWKCIQGYSVAADGMYFRQQGKYIETNTSENLYNQFIEQQNKQ